MPYKWHHNFPKIAREAGFTIRELSAGHCIDWRFIASIDPYGIVSEKDYEKLDEFIPHISEVPIGNVLNNRILDPAIGKYFILAQFSIQYLLFCKQFLDETVLEIRNTIQSLREENVRLEKLNKKRNEEVTVLQRKLQRIETMEHQHSQQAASIVYPCSKCTKNFISPELLSAHIVRKHANIVRPSEATFDRKPSSTDTNLINTIKLELEVKQLKERLNAAEKDLHNHRTKHHRCRVCSEDSSSATEKPQAKVLHSIGIQSNLTDDKDSNDREAQTQTDMPLTAEFAPITENKPKEQTPSADLISRLDLQTLLEEQKQLFESWKAGERKILNQEIATVKQNLADVIESMERSERNTPIPEAEQNVWKDRYKELEKMYEISQQQSQETIASFERVYAQKMEQMKKLLLETRAPEHDSDQHHARLTPVNKSIPYHLTGLKVVTLPTVAIEADSVTDCTKEMVQNNDQSSNVISSESKQVESDKEIRPTIEPPKKPSMQISRVVVATPELDTPKSSKSQSQSSQRALLISPKKQILNQFRARLKAIGVDPRSKQLFGENLNAAYKALADRRDFQKQKHNHFFVTRNQLLSKVEQLARGKVEETPQAKLIVGKMPADQPILMRKGTQPSSAKVHTAQPRLKASSALELLPSKQKLHLPEMGTDSNVSKAKKTSIVPGSQGSLYRPTIKLTDDDIITVHADVSHYPGQEESIIVPNPSKRASISSYDQQVERLLHTPIKSIQPANNASSKTQGLMLQENPPDISGIVEDVSMQPKPVPKKRVLFNLDSADNIQSAGRTPVPTGQQQTVEEYLRSQQKYDVRKTKVDDESDWNISSFDEDK